MGTPRDVYHEVTGRQRAALLRSLEFPHPESVDLAEAGLQDWAADLPMDDVDLFGRSAGTAVRWVAGRGWVHVRS